MMSADLQLLKNSRTVIRRRITRKFNTLSQGLDDLSEFECKGEFESLKATSLELREKNDKIGSLLCQEANGEALLDADLNECDSYDKTLTECLVLLNNKVQQLSVLDVQSANVSSETGVKNKLKLPEIPLPTFSNKEGENLIQFFLNFESIILKYTLSDYERFIYLEKQLFGDALTLIKSLTGSKRSYATAKDLLNRAFARPIKRKYDQIHQLSALKFNSNDPYKFVSDIEVIQSAFEELEIDVKIITQYFIWTSLPQQYQNYLSQVTNSHYPNLDQIMGNIFETIDTVKAQLNSNSGNTVLEPASLAAGITSFQTSKPKSSHRPCPLCSSDSNSASHAINKCEKFPNSKAKIDRIKELKLCVKCSGKHATKDCIFKFYKPCHFCRKTNHFSFLCFKNADKPLNGGICTVEIDTSALNSNNRSDNLMPTFSCQVNDQHIRVLKDSGAQTSFIREDVAKNQKLNILTPNVNLKIRGFNGIKCLETNIYEVNMRANNISFQVPAVGVPEITSTCPNRNVTEIASMLKSKGYQIADQFTLNNSQKQVDMILGVDSFHVFSISTIKFGADTCMYSTELGVMPIGNSESFSNNLKHLPNLTANEQQANSITTEIPPARPRAAGDSSSRRVVESPADPPDRLVDPAGEPPATPPDRLVDPGQCTNISINNIFLSCDDNLNAITEEIQDIKPKILDEKCSNILNYDGYGCDHEFSVVDQNACETFFKQIEIKDNRLAVPLLWEKSNSHLLGKNLNLSAKILSSMKKKLEKIPNGIEMVNEVIQDQIKSDIIKPIPNLEKFIDDNPECSFIANMPVFKENSATTKCRIVLLSNLKENGENVSLSHNQCTIPGPQLNRPIETSVTLLRFDEKLLIFDLKKAFLQLKLKESDQTKLCFLWYKDPLNGDFSIQGYYFTRVPFGLRCSSSLLMLSLYYILMYSVDNDDQLKNLKKLLYELFYVDNGAVSSMKDLCRDYEKLAEIFSPFGFDLQEFATNDSSLKEKYPDTFKDQEAKLLGLDWNTNTDQISPRKYHLNPNANTKRKILSSIAENHDIFNIGGPIMNRARIYMHELQLNDNLKWDQVITGKSLKTWKNIAKQVNDSPKITLDRCVGSRTSNYELICYVDSSNVLYGSVLFILDKQTGKLSFLMAKNRMITKNLKTKSIASLELMAVDFGVQLLHKVFNELTGPKTLFPLKIDSLKLFTDSSICLDWLRSYNHTFNKMNKKPVFIMNRLDSISKHCAKFPIEFSFIEGSQNPADCITRPVSYKLLTRSSYWSGPSQSPLVKSEYAITVPYAPLHKDQIDVNTTTITDLPKHLIDPNRFNSFKKFKKVHYYVFKFCSKFYEKYKGNQHANPFGTTHEQIMTKADNCILFREQCESFPDVISYFSDPTKTPLKQVPNLVHQLNPFKDSNGLIRIKCKISHIGKQFEDFPILMSKTSHVTNMIINDIHKMFNHAGKYTVISELRKNFYVPSCFSTVRKNLKSCTICRRLNQSTVNLNQNDYRDFRSSPERIPFRNVFVDYIGPINIRIKGTPTKVYLLIFSCLFSRAIDLQICLDLSVKNYLRAIQRQIYKHGMMSLLLSDAGTNIVSASKIIARQMDNEDTQLYLSSNGIRAVNFDNYNRGCNKLGGLVEIGVKMIKKLMFGAIGKQICNYSEFEMLVDECVHVVNRRPIGLLSPLNDMSPNESVPVTLTPEMIVHGHELVSFNVIPSSHADDWRPPGAPHILYENLNEMREKLYAIYEEEFLNTLVKQATDIPQRYKPKLHFKLKCGDIVLIKDEFIKRRNFPMARVMEVKTNALNEVTDVKLLKGATGETVMRHVSSVIPYLEMSDESSPNSGGSSPSPSRSSPNSSKSSPNSDGSSPNTDDSSPTANESPNPISPLSRSVWRSRRRRKAGLMAEQRSRQMAREGLT